MSFPRNHMELQEKPWIWEDSASSPDNNAFVRAETRDSRIHVLYLIDSIIAMGGGEGALLKIVRNLPRNRFRCSLAVFKPGMLYDLFERAGCPVYVFPVEKILSLKAFKAGRQLREFMRQQNVDIVHTFFETANLWGALVTKLGGSRGSRPVLVSSRRDMGILRLAKHRMAYRLLHPLFDSVVAVSKPVREACIRDEGIAPERVITLHNGVELDKIESINDAVNVRSTLGLSDANRVVISVGHIRRFKGFDIMIRAAAKVCREFPETVFVIAGAFYERNHVSELIGMANSLGISRNIRFIGSLDDVSSWLKASDIFCLLSRSEGFSNALVEAMACGLPVVATRVGGAEETITEGRDGFLVDSEDADAAAEKILILLRNGEMARKIGAEARETVRRSFSAESMGKAHAEHYERLLRRERSAARQSRISETVSIEEAGPGARQNHRQRRLRSLGKWAIVRMLRYTGLLATAKWCIRRRGPVVLTFHRVLSRKACSETSVQEGMIVSDETFRALLGYLQKKNYLTIDLGWENQQTHKGRLKLALTFDDGWEDTASVAFPIATEFNVPLTVFLCPGLMGQSLPFWPERVSAVIRSAECTPSGILKVSSALSVAGYADWAAALEKESVDRADRLIERFKTVPAVSREKILELISRCEIPIELFVNLKLDRMMSWSQVSRLNKGGVRFGSHTQHHEILPQIPVARVEQEVKESKASISEHLSEDCLLFSYPNGDASPDVRDVVSRSGYKLAFINSPGVWSSDSDPLLIPRINVWENHLTDSSGRFSPLTFEYSIFWRAFIHGCRSRSIKNPGTVTQKDVTSALPQRSVSNLQAHSKSLSSASPNEQAGKTGS